MMRSMYAGVAGLRNHQTRMDVIGNNIANVNTVGFKKGRVTFQDMLSQTIRGASSPQGGRGGTNPQQVGLGMTIASIDTIQTQGNLQSTGKMSDLAVQGDGFFIVGDGNDYVYTRAGAFDLDRNGNLINANGLKVMGWVPNATGVIDTNGPLTGLSVVMGSSMAPKSTTTAKVTNNLDANTAIDTNIPPAPPTVFHPITMEVYDSLGNGHNLNLRVAKTAANQWTVTVDPADAAWAAINPTTISFNASGTFIAQVGGTISLTLANGATTPQTIALDFATMTQYAQESNARASDVNGNEAGVLRAYTIDTSGTVTGVYSNGLSKTLGQVALANFSNPGGLVKEGENLFRKSNNSGEPDIGAAGKGGRGTIAPGSLEMSNVDLSQEFTDMIVTQRGFQANSRIITTSDEMLQELVNLKR